MDRKSAQYIYDHIIETVGERYFEVLYENGIHYGLGITLSIAEAMIIHYEKIENFDRCIDIGQSILEAEEVGGKYCFLTGIS